jgi:hypothetical protein
MHLSHVRNHHPAWAAPGSPEIDQDRLPFSEQRVETGGFAIQGPDGEILRPELIEGQPRLLLSIWLLTIWLLSV